VPSVRNIAFDLTDLEDLLAGVRGFVEAEVLSRHRKAGSLLSDPRLRYTEDGLLHPDVLRLIREVRMASAEAGYYTMFVPESIGGGGLGKEALYRVWEELYHCFGPKSLLMGSVISHWARGPSEVLVHASSGVRERVLPVLLSGEASMCFAMSEPDVGSDFRAMRTKAVLCRDHWEITGTKLWVTNAPYANFAVIFAKIDGESHPQEGRITAFLTPTDQPGFEIGGSIKMFGEIGGDEGLLHLDRVSVSPDMVLGDVGAGFQIAMSGVNSGRMYNSARAVGLARWALEIAVSYAKERIAFGRPVIEHQGAAFPLAESAMEIHAAHLLGLNCALLLDAGRPAAKEVSMAKAYSTEAAVRAIDRVIQAHGAIGFTNELGLVEAYRAVRQACVADGTSEILRRHIVHRLSMGDLDL
jgi:acyl-CoA dehydrogenase